MSAPPERAPAKVNLVLRAGPPEPDGRHSVATLMARLALADAVTVEPAAADTLICPRVEGPNLAEAALAAYRTAAAPVPVPPVRITIEKRIPVAAGLAGGSADAAATLRALAGLTGHPVPPERLVGLAHQIGSDVPSQLAPGHAVVAGTGEQVTPVELPNTWVVLWPDPYGLSTAAVYAELDRLRGAGLTPARDRPDPEPLVELAAAPAALAAALENDLQDAALSLRPELAERLAALTAAGARGALVSGSGPTVFGIFADRAAAARAAAELPDTLLTEIA